MTDPNIVRLELDAEEIEWLLGILQGHQVALEEEWSLDVDGEGDCDQEAYKEHKLAGKIREQLEKQK